MSPHGIKGSSKKAMTKGVSMTLNGPRMSSKKKRKLINENSDPEVLDRSAKYWHGLKIDASDEIKEKILKHLSAPSRRYKLKDEDLVLPAKKKRKLQKNGSLETDSDDEKNGKKGRLHMKKKQHFGESPSSKLRKWKKLNLDSELAAMSGTKNRSKKSLSGDSCGKGKKSARQKLLSANYEDADGVCIYDLDTPELKNKARKKKLMAERVKGANHFLNKKKVRIGKGVLSTKNLAKKQKTRVRIDGANFKLLPKKQQKKLQKRYSVQMVSDGEASDSDNMLEKNISGSACKKNRTKIAKAKWADLNKKKAKFKKHLQNLEMPKCKKLKRQQVSEEEDDDSDEDGFSSEDDVSDEYILDEEDVEDDDKDDKDDDDEEEEDDDEEDDDDDSSDEQTSDEKSGHVQGLSNGDWEKVNEEQIREVNQDAAYGNGWKAHEGEKPSSSLLHPWSQNNGISANNAYHHDPLVSQQHHQPHQLMQAGNMAAGCMPAQTMSRPMTNTSNTLPPFGAVADTAATQQHYPPQIQDSSTNNVQHFGDQQQSRSLYSGVDYTSHASTSTYNNNGKSTAAQSQNFHLQHHLLQSQTHSYSGFNHLQQSQQNNSSNVQKVKHYYPASIGKEGILEVEGALRPVPPEEVLTQGFRISIKRCDMATLVGSNWLNDEIINFYMNLIVQRGKTEGFSSVYIPSTFFFPMVMKRGYNGVRRWTKNVDIFDHDLMLIPIHLEMENHWTLIAVDFLQSSICYYDSYLQDKDEAMDAILDYLKEEMKAKKNIEMDINCWVKVNMKNIPLQENLSDCGVFSCIYAEYISRGAQMDFTQEDMPYFRRKMVYEILHQNILDHSPRDTDNLISDDILQDVCPAMDDISNLPESQVALQNGLPDSSLSPTSNENFMKVSEENSGLAVRSKDMEEEEEEEEEEEISKDSDALQSSSDVEGEQKMSVTSADEELKKRHSVRIVAEIKKIANVFEDADAKEQEIHLSRLQNLLKSHSRTLRQKNKHSQIGHRNFKDLLLPGKGESESEDSEEVSSICSTTTSSSNSSSGSMSTVGGSSEEETKSSDEANMSSSSDSLDQLKLSRIMWEVEKLLVSLTDVVRSISKASSLMSTRKRMLDSGGSFSVIKGIEFISSELQNISNHYNQVLMNQSPQNTAVKKHVITSPYYAKEREGKILQCIASQLSTKHKFKKKNKLKRLHTRKARERTKANVIPKKVTSGDEEFSHDEVADGKFLAHLVKDAGGRLLEGLPCTRKLQLQKSLLTKFPLPDGIFDLACSSPEKGHKQQAHKSHLRSDRGKKGKKKK